MNQKKEEIINAVRLISDVRVLAYLHQFILAFTDSYGTTSGKTGAETEQSASVPE